MQILSIKSVLFSSSILYVCVSVIIIATWMTYRKRFKGVLYWLVGVVFNSAGMFLMSFQGDLPVFFSVFMSNVLIIWASAFLHTGVLKLFENGKTKRVYIPHLLSFGNAILLIVFGFVFPDLLMRIIITTVLGGISLSFSMYELCLEKEKTILHKLAILFIVLFLLVMMVRIPATLMFPPSQQQLIGAGIAQLIPVVLWVACLSGLTMNLLLLITTKLEVNERRLARENDMLIKEVHHRVKNNLTIIHSYLSLKQTQDISAETRQILEDTKSRITAIGMIHDMLQNNPISDGMPVKRYISDLTVNIVQSQSGLRIKPVLEVEDIRLSTKRTVQCGLLINEIVTNACKYAFPGNEPGEISICFCRRDTGGPEPPKAVLIIRDNGKGLPDGYLQRTDETMGMSIIKAICDDMKADLKIESDGGVSYAIEFPLE